MNNEKKAPAQNSDERKKNRHNKRKGYFINPNEDKGEKQNAQKQEPKEQKPQNASQPQKQAQQKPKSAPDDKKDGADRQNEQRGGGRSHNRRRRGNRPHTPDAQNEAAKAAQNQKPERSLENEENKPQKPLERQNQKHHQGKKNRHNQKSAAKADTLLLGSLDDLEKEPKKAENPTESAEILDPSDIPSDILESPVSVSISAVEDGEERIEVVGVRFKSSGKVYYFDPQGIKYSRTNHAIVDTARGLEYGEVAMGNTRVKKDEVVPPLRPVIRLATQEDEAHHKENKQKEDEAFKICNERIASHKLDMKLIDAQYTFDNTKLLFYFTSAGRVDFRELVKDLASVFRTRIELRQIGIRDEAKLMGGLGLCGRPLCCSLFLSDFGQVSIKMAKEQNLSLNSAKISGICGRLMCCLRYEHETYEYEIKRTPPVDSLVETPDGNGVVTEINPIAATLKVRLSATPEVPPKTYKRDDVKLLQKKTPQNTENN